MCMNSTVYITKYTPFTPPAGVVQIMLSSLAHYDLHNYCIAGYFCVGLIFAFFRDWAGTAQIKLTKFFQVQIFRSSVSRLAE